MDEASLLAELHPLFVLFAITGLGLAVGRISIKGISLGSSGVIFIAIVAGHFGATTYAGVGTIGLVLFVYAVGIGAGGRFFAALAREGSTLAQLSLLVTALGALIAFGFSVWLDIPAGLAAGIYAGAMTSTPALAAATETLQDGGDVVSIGYGIAYPFGVVGVVLFVQLLPRLLRIDLDAEAKKEGPPSGDEEIRAVVVEVTNPEVLGQRIAEHEELGALGVQVTRVRRGERGEPLRYEDRFEPGQQLLVVGRARELRVAVRSLGHEIRDRFVSDVERERRQLIVLEGRFAGKPLRELDLLRDYGVIVSRITRLGFTFVPTPGTDLERNDVITAVGEPEGLERLASDLRHRTQAFDETDLLSLGVGLALGVVVGQLSFSLPGVGALSLGLAGGPLLVGLLLGHLGRIGGIVGHIPRPTRLLLQELGLIFFLVDAGLRGGGAFWETLQEYGLQLFLMGALVTLLPMFTAYFVSRRVLRGSVFQTLGGVCGGLTSTPALGAITAKTDSQVPVVSYAAAYPIALILMTLFAKLLIQAILTFGAA